MTTLTREEVIICISCCALIARDLKRDARRHNVSLDGDTDFMAIKELIDKLIRMRDGVVA